MSNTLYVMEAVNLFCGDDDPNASKHLTLSELKLPDLTETFADHKPGGGRVGIEIAVGVEKLNAPFKLNGFDPQLLTQFGLNARVSNNYTAYGVIKDQRTGRSIEQKALIEGRLGKVAGDAFQHGELQGYEYAIHGITHYEFYFDGQEKVFWDFFTNIWRIDGTDQNAETNAILRLV
jgi:P2 family phage contractile tail tube protein